MRKVDLHNDLLNYLLLDEKRSAHDNDLECSVPQMIAGGIEVQVLAAFTPNAAEPEALTKQYCRYKELLASKEHIGGKIRLLWAIEDAQQLVHSTQIGATLEQKLSALVSKGTPPVYISLTWVNENDFGGGDHTSVGLKKCGQKLLDLMAATKIAVDLSHASDRLAHDIINYREKAGHRNSIIVSHTNFRAVHGAARNIPDDVAKYILDQNGIIGLSLSRRQLGNRPKMNLREHYNYAVSLNPAFADILCLGGDLYHEADVPKEYRSVASNFYPEASKASHYRELEFMESSFLYTNAMHYLSREGFVPVL